MFPMRGARGRRGADSPVHYSRQDFRLSLESGVPVSTTDQTAKGTLYLTPFVGTQIALSDGTTWAVRDGAEASLSLAGIAAGSVHDVLARWSAGAIQLALRAWGSATVRGVTADLARVNGVWVRNASPSWRYLGTICASAADQCEDSTAKRFVFNAYNRVKRDMFVADPTDNWVYGTGSWRATNNSTSNRLEFVVGLDEDLVAAGVYSMLQHVNTTTVGVGVGVDSTTVNSAQVQGGTCPAAGWANPAATYQGRPGLGRHYLQQLENGGGNGNATWYGTHSGAVMGMWARVKA